MAYFEYEGVLWQPVYDILDELDFRGPFCKRSDCFYPLEYISGQYRETKMMCTNPKCKKTYFLSRDPMLLKGDVLMAFEAEQRKGSPITKLGKAPADAKDTAETSNYKIHTVVREDNGEEMAYVYIFKKSGVQSDGKKVQMVLDISDEEMRFDPKDLPAGELIAATKVKFKNSTTEKKYGKS